MAAAASLPSHRPLPKTLACPRLPLRVSVVFMGARPLVSGSPSLLHKPISPNFENTSNLFSDSVMGVAHPPEVDTTASFSSLLRYENKRKPSYKARCPVQTVVIAYTVPSFQRLSLEQNVKCARNTIVTRVTQMCWPDHKIFGSSEEDADQRNQRPNEEGAVKVSLRKLLECFLKFVVFKGKYKQDSRQTHSQETAEIAKNIITLQYIL